MKYYCPLILKNSKFTSFNITENIKIRKIKQREIEEFFGLKKIDFNFSKERLPGFVGFNKFIPSKRKGRYPYGEIFKKGIFDGSSDILAANYVLEINSKDSPEAIIKDINLSLIVFHPCSTGLACSFQEKETDVSFHGLLSGPFLSYLEIKNKKDLIRIREIYEKILENKKNDIFQVISGLYERAISGIDVDIKMRFISLVVSLESLCLPGFNDELKFRLSLRIAKILSKYFKLEVEEQFKTVKKIYDIRSKIIHCGKSKELNWEMFAKTLLIANRLVNSYLDNKSIFEEKNLDKICLE